MSKILAIHLRSLLGELGIEPWGELLVLNSLQDLTIRIQGEAPEVTIELTDHSVRFFVESGSRVSYLLLGEQILEEPCDGLPSMLHSNAVIQGLDARWEDAIINVSIDRLSFPTDKVITIACNRVSVSNLEKNEG